MLDGIFNHLLLSKASLAGFMMQLTNGKSFNITSGQKS